MQFSETHSGMSLVACAATLLGIVALSGLPEAATASSHTVGTVTMNAAGSCAPGFQRTNNDASGSYKCVSAVIKCPNKPFGYQTVSPQYNPRTKRFEYSCVVPSK